MNKPILFNTPMVQAILAGRKTMTRRAVKSQPPYPEKVSKFGSSIAFVTDITLNHTVHCPYGKAGGLLWVKETHWAFGEWEPNGITKTGKHRWEFKRHLDTKILFEPPYQVESLKYKRIGWYKRPSLFMTREACRIFLRITNIRVERLQEISDQDAINEGIKPMVSYNSCAGIPPKQMYENYLQIGYTEVQAKDSFQSLWQSINGEQSWNSNPWVWVIEFERVNSLEG